MIKASKKNNQWSQQKPKNHLTHQAQPTPPRSVETMETSHRSLHIKEKNIETTIGLWLLPTDQLRCTWPFYFDPPTDTLFKTNKTGHTVHTRELSGHSFNESAHTEQLPVTSVPISVHPTENCWRKDGHLSHQFLAPHSNQPDPGDPSSKPCHHGKNLRSLASNPNTSKLIEMLITGKVVFTTDGSAPEKASFGWAIPSADKTRLATCFGPTQGFKPSSYRAEGYGALSVLRFLILCIQHHQIETTAAPQGFCDNKASWPMSMKPRLSLNTLQMQL